MARYALEQEQMDRIRPEISIVIPLYNEADNIPALYRDLKAAMEQLGRAWEVIFVDDGSHDATHQEVEQLQTHDPRVCVVGLRRNFGQTAAMAAGFDHACGKTIVALDGDLQNDPKDIGMLLEKIDEGYDVV